METMADMEQAKYAGNDRRRPSYAEVEMWPTPTVHGDYNRKGVSANSGDGLATVAKWATPRAVDADHGSDLGTNREGTDSLRTQAAGRLNPDWVETLMGFPTGWTAIDGPLPEAKRSTHTRARARSRKGRSTAERA